MIRFSLLALSLGLSLGFSAACGPTKVTTESSPYLGRYQVRTVAVVPFESLATPQVLVDGVPSLQAPTGAKKSDIAIAIPPASELPQRPTTTVHASAAESVTRLVWDRLGAREGLRVKPLDETQAAVREIGPKGKPVEPAQVGAHVAKQLDVDAVVMGVVHVYQERVGSRLGAESAAVGFEMKLVSADGRTLWVGNFYEKQRPMTEDLWGFFERKGVFVTAGELAAYGVDKVLKEFPYGTKH